MIFTRVEMKSLQSKRRGATVVEFSLTLIVLVTILMGLFEFSRVSMLRHAVETAAYEGAREAIPPGASVEDAVVAANQFLQSMGIQFGTVTVSPNPIDETTTQVNVEVTIPIAQNSWLVPRYVQSGITGSISLMTERSPIVLANQLPVLPPPPPPPPPPYDPGPPTADPGEEEPPGTPPGGSNTDGSTGGSSGESGDEPEETPPPPPPPPPPPSPPPPLPPPPPPPIL